MRARHAEPIAGIFDGDFGAQHELAQRRHGRRKQLLGQDGDDSAGMGQEMQECQDPALGARVRGQHALPIREAAGIVGYLSLQKTDGIGSGESQDP